MFQIDFQLNQTDMCPLLITSIFCSLIFLSATKLGDYCQVIFKQALREFDLSDETEKSRRRIRVIIDDTKSGKLGKHMELIHKMFDHAKKRYITGYNHIFVTTASGDMVFPLSSVLWIPKTHPDHRSRNDIAADEILRLKTVYENHGCNPEETEILFDSAYCVQKVVTAAENAGFRVITKVGNTHKFEFDGEFLTPRQIS